MIVRALPDGTTGAGELIVVVDDLPDSTDLLSEILEEAGYRVAVAHDGPSALALIRAEPPDLVLLDVNMPGMSGYAVCERLKRDPAARHIPVILLTALHEINDRLQGLQMGADDFISKPIERLELLIRVRSLVRLKRQHDELDRSHQVLISLALALEARDPYTRTHSQNVAANARRLARQLDLGEEAERQIEQAGLLHDIGKIGVPDSILMKPGALTDEEFALMQTHPVLGYEICRPLASLAHALSAIRHHHERWDGRGYPDGLAGAAIPLRARIMAIADAYDAMTSDRPYRAGFSPARAQAILLAGAGSQWDPALVKIFVAMLNAEPDEHPPAPAATTVAAAADEQRVVAIPRASVAAGARRQE
jgi:putative two-component system response regulator